MIWAALAAMIAVALGFLLPPMLRQRRDTAARREAYDLAVYRDQLAELDADVARGTVSAAEAAEARLEIERRMLRAAPETAPAPRTASTRIASPVVALAVPLIAVGLYLVIGAPQLPGRPPLPPAAQAGGGPHGENPEYVKMAERLAAKLAEEPDNAEDWRLLGRTYMEIGRYAEAASAFRQGIRLLPQDADLPTMLGEALVLNGEGAVTPAAVAAFETTLKRDPRHPVARYYVALSRLQAGQPKEAFDRWLELARNSTPDAPWMRILPDRLQELAKQLKIDLASVWQPPAPTAPQPPIAGAKGPTQEQMQSAAEMSPEDRQQFIRSMVERLADKLKDNPNDPEGWQRLARAYRVLGDNDAAAKAETKLAELQRGGASAPAPAPAPKAAPPGPTPEQMQAAAQMPGADQKAMIRGMVERLAEKLKDNPDDYDGWTRLGRSYFVLGDQRQAVEAYAKAASLRPQDPIAVANHAQALAEAGDPQAPLPAELIRLFRQVLQMDALNLQALWAVGLADAQSGDRQSALEKWRRLLGRLSPGTPEFAQLQRRIAELERATQ